jgi:Nucleoside-diphosphate-sugar epimerases
MNPDPNTVIPTAVGGAINVLKAASKHGLVKRVVLTSSSTAALIPKPNVKDIVVTEGEYEYSPPVCLTPVSDNSYRYLE